MAWTTPPTAVAGTFLTAAQWNAGLRDNLLETAPAKATTSGRIFVSTGANSIAQREIKSDTVLTQQTGGLTSYGNLATAGPQVTITTGLAALVFTSAQLENSGNGSTWASYGVSGATTDAVTDERAIFNQSGSTFGGRFGVSNLHTLTAGSNVFLVQYRVSSGTGTFDDRKIIVMAL